MRKVKFKRANKSPNMEGKQHPDFITEYAYADLFKEGFHKEEDGWETLPEDKFQTELNKNDSLSESFRAELQASRIKMNEEKAKEKLALKKEFEAFKAWKASQGN